MAQRLTVICYDICDPKRLRRVFDTCKAFADHIQFSVFRAQLTPRARAELIAALDAIIDHKADQILLVDLGPANAQTQRAFTSLGRPCAPPDTGPVVV